jgi:hypothetical protein
VTVLGGVPRFLTPVDKYHVFVQVLSGEMTVGQCAELADYTR